MKTITFYKIFTDKDVVNKVDNLNGTAIDVDLFNSFDPINPTFLISHVVDANYCVFWHAQIYWYCYLEPAVAADNLYLLKGTVDPLSTAYYNHALNTSLIYDYSPGGNGQIMRDPRVNRKSISTVTSGALTGSENSPGDLIVLNVMTPYNTQIGTTNPSIRTYIIESNSWRPFSEAFLSLSAEDQQRFGNSILSIYRADSDILLLSDLGNCTDMGGIISLFAASTSWFNFSSGSIDRKDINIGSAHKVYLLDFTKDIEKTNAYVNIPLTPGKLDALFTVYVAGIGALTFTPDSIGLTNTITDIGAYLAYDPIGGTIGATLEINNSRYKQIFMRAPMPCLTPFFTDSSITNYTQIAASTVGVIGGLIATASGVGSVGLLGAAASGLSLGSEITASRQGSTTIRGGAGGFADYAENRGSFYIIQEKEYIDLTNFQTLYGKPDGRLLNVGTGNPLKGYYKARNAHIPMNGLPEQVIEQAQAIMNNGFYLK